MSEMIKVVILAIVQGVTEFLPISSSGHLVLTKEILNLKAPPASLEIFLHAGTLISLVVFYFHRLLALTTGALRGDRASWRYILFLIIAILPAIIAYLLFGKFIKSTFESPITVTMLLCVTGVILLLPELLRRGGSVQPLTWWRSVLVGIAQAVALLPGISRSGSTITMARLCRIEPVQAAEFSFLMSLPLIIAAIAEDLLTSLKSDASYAISTTSILVGVAVSAIVGYISLIFLVKLLQRQKFWVFGIYCLVVGACATLFLVFN